MNGIMSDDSNNARQTRLFISDVIIWSSERITRTVNFVLDTARIELTLTAYSHSFMIKSTSSFASSPPQRAICCIVPSRYRSICTFRLRLHLHFHSSIQNEAHHLTYHWCPARSALLWLVREICGGVRSGFQQLRFSYPLANGHEHPPTLGIRRMLSHRYTSTTVLVHRHQAVAHLPFHTLDLPHYCI